MSPRTVFLARLVGLSILLIALAIIANRAATAVAFVQLVHDPAALWLAAMLGLVAGLALVLGHNVWSGGVTAVLVTAIGWITLIKSAVILALPWSPEMVEALSGWLRAPAFLYFDGAVLLVLGLILTVGGFRAGR